MFGHDYKYTIFFKIKITELNLFPGNGVTYRMEGNMQTTCK